MDISYLPAALRGGAKVLSSVRVEQVLVDGRRAAGVVGRVVAPFTGRPSFEVRVRARRVVLAAGCMATPVLLQKSGDLANASGQVGANLQFHPGVAMLGVFPDPVHPQFGATQGYQSLHFLRDGFKLETMWAPPAVLAVRMPGAGFALKQRLARVPVLGDLGRDQAATARSAPCARAQPGAGSKAQLEPPPGRRSILPRASTRWRGSSSRPGRSG
jgi:choline dehydrogenase-like flavoprotein